MASKDTPIRPKFQNQLALALARWDNEGGATASTPEDDGGEGAVLSRQEEHILQCLGAAVIVQWTKLPTEIQRGLFEHAVSSGDPRQSAPLREQIARFLYDHKDDSTR